MVIVLNGGRTRRDVIDECRIFAKPLVLLKRYRRQRRCIGVEARPVSVAPLGKIKVQKVTFYLALLKPKRNIAAEASLLYR